LKDDDGQPSYANIDLADILRNLFWKSRPSIVFGIEPAPFEHRCAGVSKMLRVTVVESSDSSVRLRVEGRLTGRCIEELRESCEMHAHAEGMRLTLDLADISFSDAHGMELLKDLRRRGVTILNLVPYLALQLRVAEGKAVPLQNNGDTHEGG
jgi:hypothetical protein